MKHQDKIIVATFVCIFLIFFLMWLAHRSLDQLLYEMGQETNLQF